MIKNLIKIQQLKREKIMGCYIIIQQEYCQIEKKQKAKKKDLKKIISIKIKLDLIKI